MNETNLSQAQLALNAMESQRNHALNENVALQVQLGAAQQQIKAMGEHIEKLEAALAQYAVPKGSEDAGITNHD